MLDTTWGRWTIGVIAAIAIVALLAWARNEPGDARPKLHLEWKETGGPGAMAPEKKGFGTRLIERSIVNELRGAADIKYGRSGLSASIKIPLG